VEFSEIFKDLLLSRELWDLLDFLGLNRRFVEVSEVDTTGHGRGFYQKVK